MDHGTHTPAPAPAGDRSDWNKPLPEIIPPPTYAPALMSCGIVFLVWGLISLWVVSLVGLAFMIFSMTLWLRDIRKDWKLTIHE